ncbi:MAG TPA: PilZ domain-containing protein [Candidatus Binatia bacterium]|nr:PilZ domain-containing protein [Candidatus Binatia bacterium]
MSDMERRASRRFNMNLPLTIRFSSGTLKVQQEARTRDVSFRGLYFVIDSSFQAGMPVEFVLTLPKEVTMAGDVHIQCYGTVVRVEDFESRRGVAARIDRYEFLSALA